MGVTALSANIDAHTHPDEWVPLDSRRETPCEMPLEHSVTEGMRLERRRHDGAHELPEGQFKSNLISMMLRCPRRLEISDDGKWKRTSLQANDITVIPAGTPFASNWDGCAEFIAISIESDTFRRIAGTDFSGVDVPLSPSWPLKNPLLVDLARALCSEVTGHHPVDRIYRDTLGAAFAACLLREFSLRPKATHAARIGLPARSLQHVLDYVDARLEGEIALSELATVAGSSMHHFARLFKQSTGSAPHQYVLQQRLERAASLLRSTRLTIAEIAHRCGFSDQSHLANSFKRRFGQSPSTFRRPQ